MEIVCSELKIEDRLAVANVIEGDRLAFVTHLVSKLCYLAKLAEYKGQCLEHNYVCV